MGRRERFTGRAGRRIMGVAQKASAQVIAGTRASERPDLGTSTYQRRAVARHHRRVGALQDPGLHYGLTEPPRLLGGTCRLSGSPFTDHPRTRWGTGLNQALTRGATLSAGRSGSAVSVWHGCTGWWPCGHPRGRAWPLMVGVGLRSRAAEPRQ